MMTFTRWIDLNADVGENPSALSDGSEEQLLRLVSSAAVACGGHAGDDASMKAVVELCLKHGVSIGAHPGYPDPENFGRVRMEMEEVRLRHSLSDQVASLIHIAKAAGASVRHVKPHGALYNAAVHDRKLAGVIADAISAVDKRLVLVGLAGSTMLDVWRSAGFVVAAEAFADRRYKADGSLQARSVSGALIVDPAEAARQSVEIVRDGIVVTSEGTRLAVEAQTLCIHGDTMGAVAIAREIKKELGAAGIGIRSF